MAYFIGPRLKMDYLVLLRFRNFVVNLATCEVSTDCCLSITVSSGFIIPTPAFRNVGSIVVAGFAVPSTSSTSLAAVTTLILMSTAMLLRRQTFNCSPRAGS